MKLAIAIFDHEDKLVVKQDIIELNQTWIEERRRFLNEVSECTKQEFLDTLNVDDFKRLIERVP